MIKSERGVRIQPRRILDAKVQRCNFFQEEQGSGMFPMGGGRGGGVHAKGRMATHKETRPCPDAWKLQMWPYLEKGSLQK